MMDAEHVRPRALVTGGAGFLGRHLMRRLLEDGYDVICLDNFRSSSPQGLEEFSASPRLSVRRQHVADPIRMERLERIYHLACPASPVHYQADPIDTVRTCVAGATHVLELAKRTGAKVLQASTSEIYGDPAVHPQSETYWGHVNPIGPRACYDEGKRCAETLCAEYARHGGVAVKIARIFNTYGPGMAPDDGRVVSNFMMQACSGQPLTIYGDGRQTRSFCYVDDLIDGLVRLMESGPEVDGPVNLGNPEELTLLELAGLIGEALQRDIVVRHLPLPVDDPVRRRPDISRAERLLDWRPVVPVRDGLYRTARYFESWVAGESVTAR